MLHANLPRPPLLKQEPSGGDSSPVFGGKTSERGVMVTMAEANLVCRGDDPTRSDGKAHFVRKLYSSALHETKPAQEPNTSIQRWIWDLEMSPKKEALNAQKPCAQRRLPTWLPRKTESSRWDEQTTAQDHFLFCTTAAGLDLRLGHEHHWKECNSSSLAWQDSPNKHQTSTWTSRRRTGKE